MTSLSANDEFQLNILLAAEPRAIRIDESTMALHALDRNDSELVMSLNPTARDEVYLKAVRNLLADKAGFPGGYPTVLNRWSGMGQSRGGSLYRMLLLAETDAVTAVSMADEITEDLAGLAWWSLPTADNARRLLAHEVVVNSKYGQRICDHLVEFLPFENCPADIAASITHAVASGLVSEQTMQEWWRKSQRSGAYMLGFLRSVPDALLHDGECHPALADHGGMLAKMHSAGNVTAGMLLRVLSVPGQRFICCCRQALKKPEDQEIVNGLIETVAEFFAEPRPVDLSAASFDEIDAQLDKWRGPGAAAVIQIVEAIPDISVQIRAMLTLSLISDEIVKPVLSNTTATGSLMRRKLAPISGRLDSELERLLAENC